MTVFDPAPRAADAGYGNFDLDDAPLVPLQAPKKRSKTRIMAGIGLVALSAMVGAYVFVASSPETTSVMVAAGELEVGEPITTGDLRVVEIGSADGLDAVSPDDQGVLIGLTPRSPIPDGTLLNLGFFVTAEEAIPDGKVIVGAVLSPGSAPLERLRIGDPVGLVAVVNSVGVSDAEPALLGQGDVWAIGPVGDGAGADAGDLWVSVLVDVEIQIQVAQAASSELLWVTAVRSS